MALTPEQIEKLLGLVSSVQADTLDCDGCFSRIAEFAEKELSGKSLDQALEAVQRHLEQCRCCADEYRMLKDALQSLDD